MSMTIAQQFLGKLLVDTEKMAILSEPHANLQTRFAIESMILARAFSYAMQKAVDCPWYGVRGALTEEVLESISNTEFSEDTPSQFMWAEDSKVAMEVFEAALQDPCFRTVMEGALVAYMELQEQQAKIQSVLSQVQDETED